MIDSEHKPPSPAVSTRQASALLGVHESSVKRWCSSGELACSYTAGGHRRLGLDALAAFADARGLAFALSPFESDAKAVWAGVRAARKRGDYDALVGLLYGWLREGEEARAEPLFAFLRDRGVAFPVLLGRLLAPTMYRIGADYLAGDVSIGEEHRMTHLVRDLLVGLHRETRPAPPAAAERPVAVVGCARGEVHELGALMVRLLLEDAGWRVAYLGLNVPTEEFARQQRQHEAALVGISMMPPAGTPEATVMADVLRHLYDPAYPYHLVFGGRAVSPTIEERLQGLPYLSVQSFNGVEDFGAWLAELEVPAP